MTHTYTWDLTQSQTLAGSFAIEGISAGTNMSVRLFWMPVGYMMMPCVGDLVSVTVVDAEATAYRPLTEGPSYGNPFARTAVPENVEESPGAGIRVNGDDDNASSSADSGETPVLNENDLIEVELHVAPYPVPSGVQYRLERSNTNIRVWDSRTKDNSVLTAGTWTALTFTSATRSVWVENHAGGTADLEFKAVDDQFTTISTDTVHFYPFTSVVIALGGFTQEPSDPADPNHGAFVIATDLYRAGYDVHMYNEGSVYYDGDGVPYEEATTAVGARQVTSVAVLGYSWGGGATYLLTNRLDEQRGGIGQFSIQYTAYIDAVDRLTTLPETSRPPSSAYHVNYYEDNTLWPRGGPVAGTDAPETPYGCNVAETVWGATLTHSTIDDHPTVQGVIESELCNRIAR
jgi:hypothetical protein